MTDDLLRQAAEADAEADRLFDKAHSLDEAASAEARAAGRLEPGESYLNTAASADIRHRASDLRRRAERLRAQAAAEAKPALAPKSAVAIKAAAAVRLPTMQSAPAAVDPTDKLVADILAAAAFTKPAPLHRK